MRVEHFHLNLELIQINLEWFKRGDRQEQEMKAHIGPLGKLDCLHSEKNKHFLEENRQLQCLFQEWADVEPSSPAKLKNAGQ